MKNGKTSDCQNSSLSGVELGKFSDKLYRCKKMWPLGIEPLINESTSEIQKMCTWGIEPETSQKTKEAKTWLL